MNAHRTTRRTRPSLVSDRSAASVVVVFVALVASLTAATPRDAHGAGPTPQVLVATPDMSDPLFQQSVIVMLPSTQIPVAGVIINKPTDIKVRQLFHDVRKDLAGTAYFGGPVDVTEPSLVLRSSKPAENQLRLFDDVYLSIDPDSIAELLRNPGSARELRVIMGRAQWTRDQLRAEIQEGSWYVVPAEADLIFGGDPRQLWRVLVQRAQLQKVNATDAPNHQSLRRRRR